MKKIQNAADIGWHGERGFLILKKHVHKSTTTTDEPFREMRGKDILFDTREEFSV